MSDYLEIFLLGGVTIKRNGEPVKALTSRKATALFIYLACHHQQSFSRDTLASLFYGELPQERAMANLRVLLHRLNPLNDYLLVTRQTVAINPDSHYWLDTMTLEQQLAVVAEHTAVGDTLWPDMAAQLETALALYQGDFLAGFHLPEAFGFEEWMVVEQERLQRLTVEALGRLVDHYLDTGQYQSGLKQAARLLQLDPLHEAAHRQMMTLLARSGQRSAALAHYERCRQILAAELNVEPAPETTNLYECIQALELAAQEQVQVPAVRPHNLPRSLSPFIGRDEELAQLAERLLNPACQLLTLVGLGASARPGWPYKSPANLPPTTALQPFGMGFILCHWPR
jgi:DNA-binding SARP family transcriptional activator